jgi:hypothetical protein
MVITTIRIFFELSIENKLEGGKFVNKTLFTNIYAHMLFFENVSYFLYQMNGMFY